MSKENQHPQEMLSNEEVGKVEHAADVPVSYSTSGKFILVLGPANGILKITICCCGIPISLHGPLYDYFK